MGATDTKAWMQYYPSWSHDHLDYGDKTLATLYAKNLEKFADKPGLWFFGAQQTWADVDHAVRRAAAGLAALGVRPGDRVALIMPNCPQHIHAFWACQMLGAIPIEHNPLYTAHELLHPFEDHGARVAIVWDKACPVAETLREDDSNNLETIISVNMVNAMPLTKKLALKLPLPAVKKMRAQLTAPAPGTIPWETIISDSCGGDGSDITPHPVTKDDTALILYTSGTTGQPKGAQLSHGNLVANVLMGEAWVPDLEPGNERFLAALPMFHAYGMTMTNLFAMMIGGAELILLPAPDLKLIMDIMRKHTPTWLPGVPLLYERIADAAEETGISIKGVKNAFSGASTLPTATVEKWEKLTGGHLIEGYGLTETSPIIAGNPMSSNRRPGYVGIPFPDTLIRVADPEDLDKTMPDGEPGEILVKGPQVFKGYLNKPEATAASFHDGWYITGDVGIMEPDGFIRLVARIKEMIITGGFNVYPAEVEEVLTAHPDITDATVVGLPREDGSESVVAAITLAEGALLDTDALRAHCRTMLTPYKVPRKFFHFETLPRDQLGKVRRRDVRQAIVDHHPDAHHGLD